MASEFATVADIEVLYGTKADAAAVASALALKANTSALAAKADTSAIPLPANAAPPAVGDANQLGSSTRYALENHTHQSNVQAQRTQVNASGVTTWTFAPAFASPPVVSCAAETPTGAAYVNIATVIEGSVTASKADLMVVRVPKTITLPTIALSLLGLVLNLFTTAPNGVWVNCIARKPS